MKNTMTYDGHYGGWIPNRSVATDVMPSLACFVVVGWMAATGATLTSIPTGGELSPERLQRSIQQTQHMTSITGVAEIGYVRTPAESLAHIREVLKPAISDLATTFGVSRQSIYNWLNGEPVTDENVTRLQDLAEAADILADKGVTINAILLKRKVIGGQTLMQAAQVGKAREAALLLAQIHEREAAQRALMNIRLANRAKTAATADFDLPAPNDGA